MIEVTLVSMGPLADWGPGQIAPVAPPLGGPDYVQVVLTLCDLLRINIFSWLLGTVLQNFENIIWNG